MRLAISIMFVLILAGCNSFKLGNIVGTAAVGSVAYATGGVVPAASVVATKVVIDETVQEEPIISEVKTPEQAFVMSFEYLVMWGVIGYILHLIIIYGLMPLVQQKLRFRRERFDRQNS